MQRRGTPAIIDILPIDSIVLARPVEYTVSNYELNAEP
jgi:hypothetical protein